MLCINANITQKVQINLKGLEGANIVTALPTLVSFIGQLHISAETGSFPWGILK